MRHPAPNLPRRLPCTKGDDRGCIYILHCPALDFLKYFVFGCPSTFCILYCHTSKIPSILLALPLFLFTFYSGLSSREIDGRMRTNGGGGVGPRDFAFWGRSEFKSSMRLARANTAVKKVPVSKNAKSDRRIQLRTEQWQIRDLTVLRSGTVSPRRVSLRTVSREGRSRSIDSAQFKIFCIRLSRMQNLLHFVPDPLHSTLWIDNSLKTH